MAIKTVFYTTSGVYSLPNDFGLLVSVEAIGAGAGSLRATSSGGSGGGAYAKSTNVTGLKASNNVYISIGSGGPASTSSASANGADTFFYYLGSNTQPIVPVQGVLAKGGSAATSGAGGIGGLASSSVGDIKYDGGTGGAFTPGVNTKGGGGGAAGPGGKGGDGGKGSGTAGVGGGGGAAASSTSAGNNGIQGGNNVGGAGGASDIIDTISFVSYTQTSNTNGSMLYLDTPTGTQEGDLLIALLSSSSTTTTYLTGPSIVDGWIPYPANTATTTYGSSTGRMIYYKFAPSTIPSNTTFMASSSSSLHGYMLSFRGATMDAGSTVSASATTPTSPAYTVTNNNSYLIEWISSTSSGITFTTPSGLSVLASDSDANAPSSALFFNGQVNAGNKLAGAYNSTASSGTARSMIFAIAPLGSGGSGAGSLSNSIKGYRGSGGGGGNSTLGGAMGGSRIIWTQSSDNTTAGPGGGGGGCGTGNAGGPGAGYGGGAGGSATSATAAAPGANGIVVLTYISNDVSSRLSSNGDFLVNVDNNCIFDEITQSTISIKPQSVYADEFDEVSLANTQIACKFTNTGNIKTSGIFDEVTGIN